MPSAWMWTITAKLPCSKPVTTQILCREYPVMLATGNGSTRPAQSLAGTSPLIRKVCFMEIRIYKDLFNLLSGHPFGNTFPLDFFLKMCSDVFGPKFNKDLLQRGVDLTLTEYGGLTPSVTNVVFVHGSLDPWHALGITEDLSPSSTAILIPGTAHCANLYPPSKDDPAPLTEARNKIGNLISSWVKDFKLN